MNTATLHALALLADADPAADALPGASSPTIEQILDSTAAHEARPPVRRRRPLRMVAVVGAVATVAALAGAVMSTVTWPWSADGPAAIAYGVTTRSDGSVAVRIPATAPASAAPLQEQLRAAGLNATVLAQSNDTACTALQPETVPARGVLETPHYSDRDQGFIVHPDAMPAGATLVVALAQIPGPPGGLVMAAYVTLSKPPSCVAQFAFATQVPPAAGQTVTVAPS